MSSNSPNAQEHGVWPPVPESEPAENVSEPHGLPEFLSRLSVFTAALSIECFVFDFVIGEICREDKGYVMMRQYFMLQQFMDGKILTSCCIQLFLAAVSTAFGAGSRAVAVSKIDRAILIGAIIFACLCVLLMFAIMTRVREK
jgi:hypothetical protein